MFLSRYFGKYFGSKTESTIDYISYEDFIIDFPSFSDLPRSRIKSAISEATRQIDAGICSSEIVSFLAAHFLEMEESRRTFLGETASLNVEEEYSVSYSLQRDAANWKSTSYGREYRRLISSSVEGFVVV